MLVRSAINIIESHAKRSALSETEFRDEPAALFAMHDICESIKKVRFWTLIGSGIFVLGIWSGVDFHLSSILSALFATTGFFLIAAVTCLWTSAKLSKLSEENARLRLKVANNPSLQSQVDAVRNGLLEAVKSQEAINVAVAPMQRKSEDIYKLQQDLAFAIVEAEAAQARGDFDRAGFRKADAARLESKLRSLGA